MIPNFEEFKWFKRNGDFLFLWSFFELYSWPQHLALCYSVPLWACMSSIFFLGNVRVLLGVHTSQLKTYTLFKADFNIFSVFLWPCYYWSTPLPVHIKFKWLLMRNASPRLPVVNKLILCSSGGFFLIKSETSNLK